MARTKIVCTIGPASRSSQVLEQLIRAGMDVARLNFSHGTQTEHLEVITTVRRIAERLGRSIAILQDLAGLKIRIGEVASGAVMLEAGAPFTLTTRHVLGSRQEVSVELAVPQVALTIGNAIIATADEHNALFPRRPVSVRLLALDHGLMNLVAAPLGGVPMCRGAGGMAGHVRFGARTGGALLILGGILLAGALFFSESVSTLFRLFPHPVLGVILFFGGIELAASVNGDTDARSDRIILVVTAGVALWNMGAAYVTGLLLYEAARRKIIHLD